MEVQKSRYEFFFAELFCIREYISYWTDVCEEMWTDSTTFKTF